MISVVIPALNESAHLAPTLEALRASDAPHETLVADGGSADGTIAIAEKAGARIVQSPRRGRAAQMNYGAAAAHGEILLFLHADTHCTQTSLRQIEEAMRIESIIGGGFARRYHPASALLRITCALATWRCRRWGWFLGDQAIFSRRRLFEQLGGFKEMSKFEDLDFSRRMARAGKVVTLEPGVVSSARRFEKRGALLTTCRDLWLTCRYLARGGKWEPTK